MTDEHLMRQWAIAHCHFSSDLDRGLLRLGGFLSRRLQRLQAIDLPYDQTTCVAAESEAPMSATARAALAGVMACVATSALLVTVAALASAGAGHAAVIHHTMAAGPAIVPHAYLA